MFFSGVHSMTNLGPGRSGLRPLTFTVVTWSVLVLAGSIPAQEGPREPCVLGDPHGPEGELSIYPTPSQNDTAGVRVFEDEEGRRVQRILYSGGTHRETAPGRFSPFLECTEEGLVPYRIEEYEYDAQGRKSEVRWLGPHGRLARTTRYVYDRGGSRGEVFDGRTGRKLYQSHASTILGFDRDEEVITIQGRVPPGVIPQTGWGEIVHGVRYALTARSKEAPLDEMTLYGLLHNLRSETIEIALGSAHWLEVRDEEGRLVAPTSRESSKAASSRRQIQQDEAYMVDWGKLREWFPDLKPGVYRVTAWHELPQDDAVVRSTEMEIRVLGPEDD